MIILISVYIFSIFGLIYEFFFKLKKEFYFLIFLIFLTIITGTRFNTGGTDYIAYEKFYEFPIGYNPWKYDFLFITLKNIFKIYKSSYNTFLMGITIISHYVIYKIFIKYTKYPMALICLYLANNYFWQNFTILRSSLSIFCFWMSLKFIEEKKFIKFITLWILAVGFHKGAIPLVILYFVLNISFEKKQIIIALVLSFFISIFVPICLARMNSEIIKVYIENIPETVPLGFFLTIIENLIIFSIIFLKIDKLRIDDRETDEKKKILFNMSFCKLIISILVYRIPEFTRYVHYFMIADYILLIKVIEEILINNSKNRGQRWLFILSVFLIFTLKYFYIINSELYKNYQSWLVN